MPQPSTRARSEQKSRLTWLASGRWKSSPYGCNQPSNVTRFVEACPIRNIFAEALCSQQHSGEANMNPTPLECLYAERRAIQQHIAASRTAQSSSSGWRDITADAEGSDAATLAICEELIADLEARANCS